MQMDELRKSKASATVGDVVRLIETASNVLTGELKALRARVAELEAEPFVYTGVHEPARMYERNAVCTHQGSMWIALRRTQQTPGQGDGWKLCVKAGRDGKDSPR